MRVCVWLGLCFVQVLVRVRVRPWSGFVFDRGFD